MLPEERITFGDKQIQRQDSKKTHKQTKNNNKTKINQGLNSRSRILLARGHSLVAPVIRRLTHSTNGHKKVTCKARISTCFGRPDETEFEPRTDRQQRRGVREVCF